MRNRLFIFVGLVASLGHAVDGELEAKIRQKFQPLIQKKRACGLMVAVSKHGKDNFYSFGSTTCDSAQEPTPQTLWEIGSLTKSFTGLLFSQLLIKGEVQLNESVQQIDFAMAMENASVAKIPLWRLASHLSGLPRMPSNFTDTPDEDPYAHYSASHLKQFLRQVALDSSPHHEYSNLGMGLLGHLLATKKKQPFENLLKTEVLSPLGMPNTTFHVAPDGSTSMAQGYQAGRAVPLWNFDVLAGAGGLKSNAEEMLHYLKQQARVIPSPLTQAMLLTQVPRVDNPPGAKFPNYGFGWSLQQTPNGSVIVWHNGGTNGFTSFGGFTGSGSIIFVATNNGQAREIDTIALEILKDLK